MPRCRPLLLSSLLLSSAFAQEKTPPKPDRTANRGPQEVALKFHLPPPPLLSPEQSLQAFRLAPGFRIQCVAHEPMVESPVAMSWDRQGRLYVVEMRGYMNDVDAAGEDQPLGRIKRLEDLDGDGLMDRATVFVDHLLMPRSVTAFGDGALVAEPPRLLYYHDTDNDGVAERSEVVAENFGTRGGQPEHMANSLTYCQDNWLWAAGYPQRLRWQNGQFISEPTRSGGQWGLTQDDWGHRFYNYNSDFLRSDLLPPSAYARNPNLTDRRALNWRVLQDQHCWNPNPTPGVNRGYETGKPQPDGSPGEGQLRADGTLATATATCGPAIYRGDLFGPAFADNAFIPEPSANLVKRIALSHSGGVITGQNAYPTSEFLTSSDERFRPVNAANGPEGALYLVDLARGVIQHKFFLTHYLLANIAARQLEQPVNRGRIWRILPENSQPTAPKLPPASPELVPFLNHPNGLLRDLAQQTLVERADLSLAPAVQLLCASASTPQGRLQALWTLEGLGPSALSPDVLSRALRDPHEKVRAAAVRLSGPAQASDLLALLDDPSPEVRVQLALQLSASPLPDAPPAVLKLLAAGGSPLLNEAIACGARGRELELLELLLAQSSLPGESSLIQMLSSCVLAERRPARVARLLEAAAAQPSENPRQIALVKGIAGLDSDPKTKPQPRKLLFLEAAPAALDTLHAKAGPQLLAPLATASGTPLSLLELADAALAWPGKPGAPTPPPLTPLTPAQQARSDRGKIIYTTLCGACHQPTGTGLEGLAPPLLDSDWLLGSADTPIKIILHGLSGPVPVAGRTWTLEMPPLPLPDEDIASVLTYLRREWEHRATPVEPADVARIRAAFPARTHAWTAAELRPPTEPLANP